MLNSKQTIKAKLKVTKAKIVFYSQKYVRQFKLSNSTMSNTLLYKFHPIYILQNHVNMISLFLLFCLVLVYIILTVMQFREVS